MVQFQIWDIGGAVQDAVGAATLELGSRAHCLLGLHGLQWRHCCG